MINCLFCNNSIENTCNLCEINLFIVNLNQKTFFGISCKEWLKYNILLYYNCDTNLYEIYNLDFFSVNPIKTFKLNSNNIKSLKTYIKSYVIL